MGRARQPVRRLRIDRGHGPRDRSRRRLRVRSSRPHHDGSERPRHSPPLGQPPARLAERDARGAGSGPARFAFRRGAERAHQEREGDPAARHGQARRDHRARRRPADRDCAPRHRQEHRRGDPEPGLGRTRTARHRRAARQAVRGAAQGAAHLRRRGRPGDAGGADAPERDPRRGGSLHGRRHRGCPHRRPDLDDLRERQPDGRRHDGGALGQQQRHAGGDREGIQGHPRPRQVEPRGPAEDSLDAGHARRRAEAVRVRRRQDRRVQDPPEGARLHRLRPDHPRRDPQAQCRPRHQRAAARRWRAEGDQRVDLPGPPGDLVRHHRHAGAGRADAGRFGAVRLALCRPQHPAPDRRAASVDAAARERRSRNRDLPLQAPQ